jgi:thiol-disulfide isomerase/thioredoxin
MQRKWILLTLTLGCLGTPVPARADRGVHPLVVRLSPAVANIEYDAQEFMRAAPPSLRTVPKMEGGDLRYGRIRRRLAGDPIWYVRHDVPFAAIYREGAPVALRCDLNLNGNLNDEEDLPLYHYPTPAGARAALVDLAWTATPGGDSIPVSWKIRIVLEPLAPPDSLPRYRLQRVLANTGTVMVDGNPCRAFLCDGNNDGFYTRDYGDGLFIDSDRDGEVTVDPTSAEFLPFGVSAQIGRTLFESLRIDIRGTEVDLGAQPGQKEQKRADVGDPAPDFSFESLDHRYVRLSGYRGHPVVIYFWASWCASCVQFAPALRGFYDRLHPRGLEIVSVSFDEDRAALLAFEVKQREPWPISFIGRAFFENPIGRLYGVPATGAAYLVDSEGKFRGLYYNLEDLEEKAGELLNAKSLARP